MTVGGKRVKLQIWDAAGQERFRSVTRSYYRGAAGCLVVYDIASKETFERTANWVRDARTLASLDISTVLVGNKLDLRHDRAVGVVEASAFAQEHGLLFLEASALTGEGVEEAFLRCARAVLSRSTTASSSRDRRASSSASATATATAAAPAGAARTVSGCGISYS